MLTNVKIDQCFSPGGKSIMVARQQEDHTCALSHSTHLCQQIHFTFWTNTFQNLHSLLLDKYATWNVHMCAVSPHV